MYQLSEATGVPQPDLVAWVLWGAEPRFPRVTAHIETRLLRLPLVRDMGDEGEVHTFERVVLSLHTADFKAEEMSDLTPQVRSAFTEGRQEDDVRRQSFNDEDALLLGILEGSVWPDVEEGQRVPRGFWQEIRERWIDAGGSEVTAHALKLRGPRIRKKLHLLTIDRPAPQESPAHQEANR